MVCVLALTLAMSVCAFAADTVTEDEAANYKSAAETLISQIAGFSDEEIENYLAQDDAFTTLLRSQPLLSLKKQKQMLS